MSGRDEERGAFPRAVETSASHSDLYGPKQPETASTLLCLVSEHQAPEFSATWHTRPGPGLVPTRDRWKEVVGKLRAGTWGGSGHLRAAFPRLLPNPPSPRQSLRAQGVTRLGRTDFEISFPVPGPSQFASFPHNIPPPTPVGVCALSSCPYQGGDRSSKPTMAKSGIRRVIGT